MSLNELKEKVEKVEKCSINLAFFLVFALKASVDLEQFHLLLKI